MRLIAITLPAGLALACGGALMWYQSSKAHAMQPLPTGPVHPVTAEMVDETSKMTLQVAPRFEADDVDGNKIVLDDLLKNGPVYIYFIKEGCPCSVSAEPLFRSLYKHLEGQVQFVAVTDGNHDEAKAWQTDKGELPYPIISDPDLKIIELYKATNSVFSVLIQQDGMIAKMWPGYSRTTLTEINEAMASVAGIQATTFDTAYAPLDETSGCPYDYDTNPIFTQDLGVE